MLRRVCAIIGLVLMSIFTVTFVLYLIDANMFRGLPYLMIFCGGLGLAFYGYIYLDNKFTQKEEQTLQILNAEPAKNVEESSDDNQD